jgi:hypothetical protein
MREVARQVARRTVQSKPHATPTMGDLYLFLLRCFDNNAEAAEGALCDYLEGRFPEPVRKLVQAACADEVTPDEASPPGKNGGELSGRPRQTDLLGTPTCLCEAKMDLVRVEPHPTIKHAEIRAYECPRCGRALAQTFGDDSGAQIRRADVIGRPLARLQGW